MQKSTNSLLLPPRKRTSERFLGFSCTPALIGEPFVDSHFFFYTTPHHSLSLYICVCELGAVGVKKWLVFLINLGKYLCVFMGSSIPRWRGTLAYIFGTSAFAGWYVGWKMGNGGEIVCDYVHSMRNTVLRVPGASWDRDCAAFN